MTIKDWYKCTIQEQVARWENAARVLENLSEHERRAHWDMGTWGQETTCGTVACAAGFCGMDPWFKSRGLELKLLKDGDAPMNYHNHVIQFFGHDGVDCIFGNGDHRPVSKVIREIKGYISFLKAKNEMDKLVVSLEKVGIDLSVDYMLESH